MHDEGRQVPRVYDVDSPGRNQVSRVAVIAVHGVGKHEPGSSAQAMAELLLGLNAYTSPGAGSPYAGFDATKIEVPLPAPEVFWAPQAKPVSWFEERRGFFADKFRLRSWKLGPPSADLHDEFTLTQIGDYKGDQLCSKYESVRLEGSRTHSDNRTANIDIYEMFWADLAKRNNSLVRFFMSFYQLLIHLSSLGRAAIDYIALEHANSLPWFLLQRSYSYATRVLTLGMFNFLMLLPVVVFAPIILTLEPETSARVAPILLAVAAFGVVGLALWKVRPRATRGSRVFFILFAVVSLAAGGGAFALHHHFLAGKEIFSVTVLALTWWMVMLAIVYFFIFKKYDEVRAGAKEFGLVCIGALVLGFVACLCIAAKDSVKVCEIYEAAAFLMVQYMFLVLRSLWIALLLLALFSWIMEFICIRFTALPEEKARARAAFRTGRFALAVPTVLLLLLTMFFWSGAFYFTRNEVTLYQSKAMELPQAPLPHLLKAAAISDDEISLLLRSNDHAAQARKDCFSSIPKNCQELNRQKLSALLVQSAPIGLPLILGSLGIGFLLLVLLVAPSALMEGEHPLKATNAVSRRLGGWLSGAFSAFPVIIYCFWLAAFGIPGVCFLVATIAYFLKHTNSYMFFLYTWLFHESIVNLTLKSGPVIAVVVVFLTTAGKTLFKSASTILDTILDVDNYLRTSPAKKTPRARVVERYVGLLHFLHEQRYDRIVIVAHSLGSLISADLLRFLKHNRIPSLTSYAFAGRGQGSIPISLFTMGNPLRQLLNRFFPNLYRYVRPVPDDSGEAPQPPVPVSPHTVGTIPANALPTVSDLGIQIWINHYRSGDYVGRSLWLDEWMNRTVGGDQAGEFPRDPRADIFADNTAERREACIGLGAHTHYWNRTAPDIGVILDELIWGD